MFRSLWFRLTGTVVLVVVVTMVIALVASLVIMQREFVNFVNSAVDTLQREPVEITVPEAAARSRCSRPFPDVRVTARDFKASDSTGGESGRTRRNAALDLPRPHSRRSSSAA